MYWEYFKFVPSPQLAHITNTWTPYAVLGAFMHGFFSILIGLLTGLFVVSIHLGLLRNRFQRLSWRFWAAITVSLLGLVLLCLIEVIGSYDVAMFTYYGFICELQTKLHTFIFPGWGYGGPPGSDSCDDYLATLYPDSIPWLKETLLSLQLVLPLVSDGMIVRRTQVLIRRRPVTIVLGLSWALTFTAAIAVVVVHAVPQDWQARDPGKWPPIGVMSYAFLLSSALCNLLATVSVATKLWLYRRNLTNNLKIRNPRFTRPQRLLVLFVESGTLYCIIQVAYIIILTLGGLTVLEYMCFDGKHYRLGNVRFCSHSGSAAYVFQQAFIIISGLYPVMISLVLNIQALYPQSQTLSVLAVIENTRGYPIENS